jgi:hypothetical protein
VLCFISTDDRGIDPSILSGCADTRGAVVAWYDSKPATYVVCNIARRQTAYYLIDKSLLEGRFRNMIHRGQLLSVL